MNCRVNEKKKIIALRRMLLNAESIAAEERAKAYCSINKVNYLLLSEMDDYTFDRAMELNQIENFLLK
jgi:hypothetical protein